MEPHPPHWDRAVLTSGLLEKSQDKLFLLKSLGEKKERKKEKV